MYFYVPIYNVMFIDCFVKACQNQTDTTKENNNSLQVSIKNIYMT
jgi:hypothetical protein